LRQIAPIETAWKGWSDCECALTELRMRGRRISLRCAFCASLPIASFNHINQYMGVTLCDPFWGSETLWLWWDRACHETYALASRNLKYVNVVLISQDHNRLLRTIGNTFALNGQIWSTRHMQWL
jgi:hypothetical protein